MIAAKVRDSSSGDWIAWIGVNLEHIRKDVESVRDCPIKTLHEIPLALVRHLDCYANGEAVVEEAERRYRGEEVPYIPGTTTYYLGPLMTHDAHHQPA